MSHRLARINSLIRQELSDLLRREVKDPRLSGMITITRVETAADIKYSRVFVSALAEKEEQESILKSLSSAAGFFRSELAKNLDLRHTPELEFRWDNSIEHGARVLELLDQVKRQTSDLP